MYDPPSALELLEAVRIHLEKNIIPLVREDRQLYYQTLVAINVLKITGRDMQSGLEHVQTEWKRLNHVQNQNIDMPATLPDIRAALVERNRKLCEEIDGGRYDYQPQRAALFEHLLVTTQAQLEVANPEFLIEMAREEVGAGV